MMEMKQLKIPEKEDIYLLKKELEFNEKETAYFDGLDKKSDEYLDKKDYRGLIDFYTKEFSAKEKLGSVTVKRRLMYLIGHAYECMGTFGFGKSRHEGGDPLERAEMFEQAVMWYQAADEIVGFFTDYSLRQSEACGGAAYFRTLAGLEDGVTEAFARRQANLISTVLGGITGGNVTIIQGPLPDYLKQKADKKIDGSVKTYSFDTKKN